jgi:hypothetical protein
VNAGVKKDLLQMVHRTVLALRLLYFIPEKTCVSHRRHSRGYRSSTIASAGHYGILVPEEHLGDGIDERHAVLE